MSRHDADTRKNHGKKRYSTTIENLRSWRRFLWVLVILALLGGGWGGSGIVAAQNATGAAALDAEEPLPVSEPTPEEPLKTETPSATDQSADQAPEQAPDKSPSPSTKAEDIPGTRQVVDVGDDDRITMHLSQLPLADAIQMLSEPTKRNIVLADGAIGTVTASLYSVTFEEALLAMLVSNGLGYRMEGEFIFVHPLEELRKMSAAKRKIESRVFHLSYITAAAAKALLEPLISNVGKIAVTPEASTGLGGTEGISDTEGDAHASADTLLVTDYVDRLVEIEQVLKQVDTRPKQVLIEATILRATLNEDSALGIDFTTVGGIDFTTLSSTSPAAQSIATGATPVSMLGDTTLTARTEFNDGLPSGGFTFGIIKDQVGVFIRALEQITDTNILANPKVLALNKQIGQVIVGRRDGYFTTTVTETSTVQTVEFLETGTILTFRPYIGNDGYVRMEIHPKDSTGSVGDNNLPFEQTTEVTTNVMVRDGYTILIGGLFREVSDTIRGQVPGLGNLPGIGALFRRTRDGTLREEVIILLTVHILEAEEADEIGRDLAQDSERLRVGGRKGAQWLGRERVAQQYYRWALEHLEAGDIDKTLWDARMALSSYPRHVLSAKLLEKLLGERVWEDETSVIRDLIRDRLMRREPQDTPPYGRPAPPFRLPEGLQGSAGFEEDEDVGVTDGYAEEIGQQDETHRLGLVVPGKGWNQE